MEHGIIYLQWDETCIDTVRDVSSMTLVRLKPQAQARIGARTAPYNENLQSRTRTTLDPKISRKKINGLLKIFGLLKFLESDALVDNLNV